MNEFTKSDKVHILAGLVGTLVWCFGGLIAIPAEAVNYAQMVVGLVVGSAFGNAVASGKPVAETPELPPKA